MSLREIIGGDKIITKNRLQVELHNFWLKLLPYIKTINFNKKMAEATDVSIFMRDMGGSVEKVVLQGTNEEVGNIIKDWLRDENGVLSFGIESMTYYTDAQSHTHLGRVWSIMELSQQERFALKQTVNRTGMTEDYVTQVFVNQNNNAETGFGYINLKYVEIQMSSDEINEAYVKVVLDANSVPSGVSVTFDVYARRFNINMPS